MYSLLSALCLALLVGIVLFVVIDFFKKNRAGRIEFIRTFKKGSCIVIYGVAIPLYYIGFLYGDTDPVLSFFYAVQKSLGLIVLNYDVQAVGALMGDDPLYRITIIACFVAVTLNAILFALSLFLQRTWAFFRKKRWWISKKDKLLIVGTGEDNHNVYATEKKRAAMLIGDFSSAEQTELYAKKMSYIAVGKEGDEEIRDVCSRLLDRCMHDEKQSCAIVVNTGDDAKNIAFCRQLLAVTSACTCCQEADAITSANRLSRVKVYVFGSASYETIYNEIVETSHGCLRYVNRHLQIAMDFIDRYPLTRFMTEKHLDTETSLVDPKLEVNVVMVGFGRSNRQIFLTSVANNQLLTGKKGEPFLKQVKYLLIDRDHPDSNKNLNHGYWRFESELGDEIKRQKESPEASPYLPLPALPALTDYVELDINNPQFYKRIKKAVSGKNKFNYIIVAVGDDLENIDLTQKLIEKKQEWGLENTYVFTRVENGSQFFPIFCRDDCHVIGDSKETIYNMERIDDDVITSMAMMRNRIYALESKIKEMNERRRGDERILPTAENVRDVYAEADCRWYLERKGQKGRSRLERESNLYACLSLRSKLHMMGLDYEPISGKGKAITEEEYIRRYAGKDIPDYYENITADGKPIVKYDLVFKESRRKTMAIHEHCRWNSFMISKGFVPASRERIVTDTEKSGKDYGLRLHNNLTTFGGLVEFRRLIAKRDDMDELDTDVIKYDYQLMDDAYWILTTNGYKIVERTPAKEPEAK